MNWYGSNLMHHLLINRSSTVTTASAQSASLTTQPLSYILCQFLTMDGSIGVVDVSDSLPPVVTSTLTSQIAAILKYKEPEFKLRYITYSTRVGGATICCGICRCPVCWQGTSLLQLPSAVNAVPRTVISVMCSLRCFN